MKEQSPTVAALSRASRRVAYHLVQATIEGLKAVEAVIEEVGTIRTDEDETDKKLIREKIEIQ